MAGAPSPKRPPGSTIAGNSGQYPGGADGAGIYSLVIDAFVARTAQTTLLDTIVAGNLGTADVTSNRTTYVPNSPQPEGAVADINLAQLNLVRVAATLDGGTISGSPLSSSPRRSLRTAASAATPGDCR